MKPERWTNERLQSSLDFMRQIALAEDCVNRLEIRALVEKLNRAKIRQAYTTNDPWTD